MCERFLTVWMESGRVYLCNWFLELKKYKRNVFSENLRSYSIFKVNSFRCTKNYFMWFVIFVLVELSSSWSNSSFACLTVSFQKWFCLKSGKNFDMSLKICILIWFVYWTWQLLTQNCMLNKEKTQSLTHSWVMAVREKITWWLSCIIDIKIWILFVF